MSCLVYPCFRVSLNVFLKFNYYGHTNSSTCTYNLPVGEVPLSSVVALITDQLPATTTKVKLNVVFDVHFAHFYSNYCSMTRHIKVNQYTHIVSHFVRWKQCHRLDTMLYNYLFSFSQCSCMLIINSWKTSVFQQEESYCIPKPKIHKTYMYIPKAQKWNYRLSVTCVQ